MARDLAGNQTSRDIWKDINLVPSSFCSFLIAYCDWHIFYRKFLCPWEGCDYGSHEKSNLTIHYRRQCVLFIFFHPPHWCIPFFLALKINPVFVQITRITANSDAVILPLYFVTGYVPTAMSPSLRLWPPSPSGLPPLLPDLPSAERWIPLIHLRVGVFYLHHLATPMQSPIWRFLTPTPSPTYFATGRVFPSLSSTLTITGTISTSDPTMTLRY